MKADDHHSPTVRSLLHRARRTLRREYAVRSGTLPSLGLVAFVIDPNVFALVAGTAPLIFFNPTVNSMVIGYRVALVPDRLQGRVNSVARSLALLAYPVGPVVAGLLLASYSARATAAFVLAGFVILAIATTVNRSIRGAPSFDEVVAAAS